MDDIPGLTEKQWGILDSLADGQQPFEQVFRDYATLSPSAAPKDLLADLFSLEAEGLVAIRQGISEAAPQGQAIHPATPEEITRDVQAQFDAFAADYARVPVTAAPLGLWLEVTSKGEAEWGEARYKPYWREAPPPPAKEAALPRWFPYAVAGLILLLMAVGVWGYTQGTFSVSGDNPVKLGACLVPMRATLASAGAPAEALQQLAVAAQPHVWQSDALDRLVKADRALDSMPATTGITETRAALRSLIAACKPFSLCQCR
jgi:hypothetical protein